MNSKLQRFWGDLHNHCDVGYGKGSLDRTFRIARNTLDFHAFTPHTWWPDLPDDDPAVREKHLHGFRIVKENWERIQSLVREANKPGEFASVLAWEWHSLKWGDYCVYLPGDEGEFLYADTLDELKQYAVKNNAVLIPHHPAYRRGWRGVNWDEFDANASPVVEIYSEHGNSLEPACHFGMYAHSMGGLEKSQCGIEQLKKGARFGFTAGTDDHYGYPGGYNHGLTAALAPSLDRASILDAIRRRHTYAVTGDRVDLDFHVNEGMMGDSVKECDKASLNLQVRGRSPLRLVEILKNGEVLTAFTKAGMRQCSCPSEEPLLARIEWGWDALDSKDITCWDMDIVMEGGRMRDVAPCFCGGAGSITEINEIERVDERKLRIRSFTSRKNALPVSGITFFWNGDNSSRLIVNVTGRKGDAVYTKERALKKADLMEKDAHIALYDRFSAPKIKIHALVGADRYFLESTVEDESVRPGDYYFLRVMQDNGQKAWGSPVWVSRGGG